jgi:adenylate cyclase
MISNRRLRSVIYAFTGTIGFLLVFFLIHLPHGPEHWSGDLRTAYLSKRLDSQHPRVVLVEVTDKTLERNPYVTPIDRRLLADLVRVIDAAAPKAIGLDFVFERPTELLKDEDLLQSIRDARAPVILGALDEGTLRSDGQRAFQAEFLTRANRAAGHLYFDEHHNPLVISDHVVRFIATLNSEQSSRQSFAELLARTNGSYTLPKSNYISWLLPPKDQTETFLTLSAEHVLGEGGLPAPLPLNSLFRDKVVLIGGNVSDRDRHLTPLSVINDTRYSGLFIHAQILAQFLDHRSIYVLGLPAELVIASIAIALGFWIGRKGRFEHYHLLIELGGVVGLVVVSVVVFVYGSLVFPFIGVLLAWLAGMTAGQYSTWVRE